LEFPEGGDWDSLRPKLLRKHIKLNWNSQRGGEALKKIPSLGISGFCIAGGFTMLPYPHEFP